MEGRTGCEVVRGLEIDDPARREEQVVSGIGDAIIPVTSGGPEIVDSPGPGIDAYSRRDPDLEKLDARQAVAAVRNTSAAARAKSAGLAGDFVSRGRTREEADHG